MMLNAAKAKEIMYNAMEEYNAKLCLVIDEELESVCEDIRNAAARRRSYCRIAPDALQYPDSVRRRLEEELGFRCITYSDGTIVVNWAIA